MNDKADLTHWHPDVAARLHNVLDQGQPGDFAVFDFDNTCIYNDIGDMVFHHFVEHMLYRFDDDRFWACFDPEDRPDLLKQRTLAALAIAPQARANHPAYLEYLGHFSGLYQAHDQRHGHGHAYLWVVHLLVGLTAQNIHNWSADAYKDQLQQPIGFTTIPNTLNPDDPIKRPTGVRICQSIRLLFHALRQAHIKVWIVSASSKWWVEPFAKLFDVPTNQVLGNRLIEDNQGVLTEHILEPKSYRQGKVDLIREHIHPTTPPVLAVGDAMTDFEMLEVASRLSLVIDKGNLTLRQHAQQRGWAIQPREHLNFVTQ